MPTSFGLFPPHGWATALLPRSLALPLHESHTNQPLLRGPECLGVKERGSLVQGGHLRLSSPRCCGHHHPLWVSWTGRWPEVDWKESRAVVCRTQSADAGSRSAVGYVPTSLQLFHLCDSLWETSGTASD